MDKGKITTYVACISLKVFIDIPIEADDPEEAVAAIRAIQEKMVGDNIVHLGTDITGIGGTMLDFEMGHIEGITRNGI